MEKENESLNQTDFRRGGLECVGGPISLEHVKLWTGNYRKANNKDVTTSHFFGRVVIEKILRQPGCVGIRMHYAIDDRGHKQLVLSGVNRVGNDQLPRHLVNVEPHNEPHAEMLNARGDDETGELYDQSWPCPGSSGCPSNGING